MGLAGARLAVVFSHYCLHFFWRLSHWAGVLWLPWPIECEQRREEGMKRLAYIVRFNDGKVNHVCLPKRNPIGKFSADKLFGGGLSIACGKPCKGDAVISHALEEIDKWATCSSCRRHLGLKPKKDKRLVPWTGTQEESHATPADAIRDVCNMFF